MEEVVHHLGVALEDPADQVELLLVVQLHLVHSVDAHHVL